MAGDWTSSETISPPNEITIEYRNVRPDGTTEQKSVGLTSTTRGRSESTYQSISYLDRDSKLRQTEVVARKIDTTETTIASVNPGYVAWRLTKGMGLPSGAAKSENITTSQYIITVDGPVLVREVSEQYVSMAQFSGGLQIEDWGNFQPSGFELVLSHRTIRDIRLLKASDGRDVTQTKTSRWMAAAESSEWKNYASKRAKEIKSLLALSPGVVEPFVRSLIPLVYEGTEVQVETGRMPVAEKPSSQDIARQEVTDGGTTSGDSWPAYNQTSGNDGVPDWAEYVPGNWQDYNQDSDNDGVPDWAPYVPNDNDYSGSTEVSNEKFITGVVVFDGANFVSPASTVTATYDMPFAPDDYFAWINGARRLIRGNATAAAEAFGRMESALDIGHAYGQNIVTGWNETPSLDLSPVYIQLAGIEGALLLDSTSYAWDADGMVISADLMLLGVSGYYGSSRPATSWLRLPVAVTALQQVSAGTTGTANKANSIVIPSGFDARNPGAVLASLPSTGTDSYALYRSQQGVIAPTLELERFNLETGPAVVATDFEYALALPSEAFQVGTGVAIVQHTAVLMPSAAITAAGLAPAVSSGASVAIPAAAAIVEALTPVVVTGASVTVPAAAVLVEGSVPQTMGQLKTSVIVPAGVVAVAGLAPAISSGASVAVPAGVVTVAGAVPAVIAYQYQVFLSSGTWNWVNAGSPSSVDVLLVGGGGGGGSRSGGGGGGAGGLVIATAVSVSGNVSVTVGAGGAGASSAALNRGSDGSSSLFGGESAAGGGGGGEASPSNSAGTAGRAGGSGGGGGRNDAATASGGTASPSGQGNAGGIGGGSVSFGGGGGGGYGSAGGGREAISSGLGGVGGNGVTLASLGWEPGSGPATVCVGGQGGRTVVAGASGGQGGGGSAPTDQNGTNGGTNTGGGGGGGSSTPAQFGSGGSGGSGLVIVRWTA